MHLVSGTPKVLPGGTFEYTASRDAGGYVVDPDHPIKVGTNGVLIIRDLPYGRYEVTETSADDPMYVLEHAFVDVGEHNGNNGGKVNETGLFGGYNKGGTNVIGGAANGTGDYWNNRYDGNIRDKIKTNKIKLVKVDSETGKNIPLKGTKVFIRYKGNPDYTDEENQNATATAVPRSRASTTVSCRTQSRLILRARTIPLNLTKTARASFRMNCRMASTKFWNGCCRTATMWVSTAQMAWQRTITSAISQKDSLP